MNSTNFVDIFGNFSKNHLARWLNRMTYLECSNSVRCEVGEVGEIEIRGDKMYKLKMW